MNRRTLPVALLAAAAMASMSATMVHAGPQSAAAATADATAAEDIRGLARMYRQRSLPTPFPGLYRLDMRPAAGPRRTAPVLLTRGAEYSFNNGRIGPAREPAGTPVSQAEWGELVMRWRNSIRTGDLVQFGDGPLRLIVLSAFDCPYSKKLEAMLMAAHVRYAVIPTTIANANTPYLRDLWCNADRASVWRNAMDHGRLPPPAGASCRYDADYFDTLGGLMGTSTPVLLYADGGIGRTYDMALIRDKLAELAKRDIRF